MKLWTLLIFLLGLASQSQAYNILILAPIGSPSEYWWARDLGETLTGVGHQVTLVTGHQPTKKSPVKEIYMGSSSVEEMNFFDIDIWTILSIPSEMQPEACKMMYENEDILNLQKKAKDFDAIIAFSFFNEVIAPFLIDYKGAYIGLCNIGMESGQIFKQGNRMPVSVTPHIMLDYIQHMTFFERVTNLGVNLIFTFTYDYFDMPQLQMLLENYFPGMPSAVDLYSNYSLLLINSHFSMDGLYPLLPNQVEIGTLAARLPQPLPKDILDFVDSAEHGVIFFSLGSVAKSTDIPKEKLDMLVEAFRHLPQRVVWKHEAHIENLPSNVLIRKFLPQQDILGHPKTLLFISHCGNFGSQEARFHGVPVLGVPISFDQHRNAAHLAKKGYARVLNWGEMTVELIIENINILIKDTSYRDHIRVVSRALQDQKESPKERAVWWIEYVIRHKDAPHLYYAGKNLNAIQYHLIDVWAFLITVLILWILLNYWCFSRCYRKIVRNKSKKD